MLLTEGVKRKYAVDISKDDITVGQRGKPYFTGYPFFFNISHCRSFAVCCLSDTEKGADCEEIRQASDNVMKRCFSPEEIDYVNSSAEKDMTFTRLWTLKESYVKYTGKGIADNLKNARFDLEQSVTAFQSQCDFSQLIINNKYIISVCTAGSGKISTKMVHFDIDFDDILVYNVFDE